MNWGRLFETERDHYRERARDLIESGRYENFELEELAMMLYRKDSNS